MDGTVIDSEPYWLEAETKLVESYGGVWTPQQTLDLTGLDLHDTAGALQRSGVPLATEELIHTLVGMVRDLFMAAPLWRPGIRRALAECAQAKLACALVSMSWRHFTEAVCDLAPGAFAAIVSGDDVKRGKPEPEAYLVGAAKLGLAPAECLVIEDSPTGVASALAAEMATIAVPNAGCAVAPADGLTILDSPKQLSVRLMREIHSRHWATRPSSRRTADTGPGTSTSRRAAL
jgi:HAD superfamily hydrolase (TIGR01509 family)